jgi:hypothetical protein
MNHHHHTGSLRHNGRSGAVQPVQTIDSAEKTVRRKEIVSDGEKKSVVRRWLYHAKSVRQLANALCAEESAVENVLRQNVYRVYPPMRRTN